METCFGSLLMMKRHLRRNKTWAGFNAHFRNSPEARLERAERYWENQEYNKVRLELEELSNSRAQDLYNMSLQKLLELNLDEAHARYSSGDTEGAEVHLGLAKEFGATRQQVQSVRKSGRAIQSTRTGKNRSCGPTKSCQKQMQGDDQLEPPSR